MGPDEDDFDQTEPLPDPTLRAWRHPSELAAVAAMAAREEERGARRRHRLAYGSLLLGGALGAVAVLSLLGSVRLLDRGADPAGFPLQEAGSASTDGGPGSTDGPLIEQDGSSGSTPATDAPHPLGGTTTIAAPSTTVPTTIAPSTTDSGPATTSPPVEGGLAVVAVAVPAEAIVGVALGEGADPEPRCTGLAVDGLVVTSASAIGKASHVTLVVAGQTYRAPVVGRDAFTDIAVIEPPADATLRELGRAGSVAAGTPVALVATDGHPEPITVGGQVTGWDQTGTASDGHDLIGLVATSARLPQSGAGSPLVDEHGALVGMVVDSPSHLAMAVPEATLRTVARSLVDTGHPVPVWVGVQVLETDHGISLAQVSPDGPAEAAGLQKGDVITSVDGQPVRDLATFFTTVRSRQVGDRLAVAYQRGDQALTTEIALTAPPLPHPTDDEQAAD